MSAYMERIYSDDWTLDPSVFAYNIDFRPNDYVRGLLAENYEFTDPTTFVLHLRHGIHWQDLPPANGRELIASDIVNHYDRLYGLDSGMTPSPLFIGVAAWKQLTSVTADGDYTVVFKWKIANPEFVYETLQASGPDHSIECPENVKQWGNLNDWHHAIGTGPFILQDFVSGSGATLVANPNYWKHDERYPQNLLPYINTLKVLIIPDKATTLPFNDKRVRIAMQMALNLPELAATYYNGSCSPDPSTQTSNYMTGWGFPYSDWPQDLKDEYAFNPTQAKALLVAAGVTLPFHTDVVTDAAGDMNLLQIVKSEFADVGINMDIIQKETNDWIAYVRTSRKQDALANRMGAGGLGITYEPLMQFGRFVKASSSDYVMVDDPVYTAFQPKSLVASTLTEVKQLLRDQNEYVARQHYLISLLQPMSYCLTQPWLKGYTGQTRGISGANNPFFMGFYAARLWIDPSLKK
jgi:peptide/nickel transport system substrate-binding protein